MFSVDVFFFSVSPPLSPHLVPQLATELTAQYPNLIVQKPERHIVALHTKIRDKDCDRTNFVFYANRLNRLLMEEALGLVEYADKPVTTPTGNLFAGTEIAEVLAAVSILRAGESMERVMWCVVCVMGTQLCVCVCVCVCVCAEGGLSSRAALNQYFCAL